MPTHSTIHRPVCEIDVEVPSLLDRVLAAAGAVQPPPQPAVASPLVGECLHDVDPVSGHRCLISYRNAAGQLCRQWLARLASAEVQIGDSVLLVQPDNQREAVIVGVLVKGRGPSQRSAKAGPRITLQAEETLSVTTRDGQPLLEVSLTATGPCIRLSDPDVHLELPGELRIDAAAISMQARTGEVRVEAESDVIVKGDVIRLN